MARAEARGDGVEGGGHLVVVEAEDVLDDAGCPPVVLAGQGVAGDEQLRDDPGRVGPPAAAGSRRASRSDVTPPPVAAGGRAAASRSGRASTRSPWLRLGPVRLEAVVAAAGLGIPHRDAGVVVADEPVARRARRPAHQSPSPVDGSRRGRRRRPSWRPRSAAGRTRARGRPVRRRRPAVGDRCPSTVSRSSSQRSSVRPSSTTSGRSRRSPAAISASGEHGVGVGEARLGPRPAGSLRRPTDRSSTASLEQTARAGVGRGSIGEHLGRAERGERHRPGPRRALLGAPPKYDMRALAHPARRRRAAAAVPNAQRLRPQQSSTPRRPVPAAAGRRAGCGRARSTPWASATNRSAVRPRSMTTRSGLRLAGDGDEQRGPCRRCSSPVRGGPQRGRRARTCRCRRSSRRGGRTTGAGRSRVHRVRRRRAAAAAEVVVAAGDRVPRELRRQPARLGGHLVGQSGVGEHRPDGRRPERRGRAGGRRSRRRSPAARRRAGTRSTTTGRPAATASTSTPDVTWSSESYGSTTRSAERISSVSAARSR